MFAVLNRPIVTDLTPALRPPWVLLALFIVLLAIVAPRDHLPAVLVASCVSVILGMLVDWLYEARRRREAGVEAESERGEVPPGTRE